MKHLLLLFLAGTGLLLLVMLVRTFNFESRQTSIPAAPQVEVSPQAVRHLSSAIRIPTVSDEDPLQMDSSAFYRYVQFLQKAYPCVDSLLEKQVFNDFSLLYKWRGSNEALLPILFMSHFDVVPIELETLTKWRHAPYSGAVVQDTVWGRGAIDDKMAGIAILEAMDKLVGEGFRPERTIYLSLGHDEEKGGRCGAAAIAANFREKGVKFDQVIDEGGAITQGIIPNVEKDIAFVGIAEKGYLDLELSVEAKGGHSSIPLDSTAIDLMSEALARLKDNIFPARISKPVKLMLDYLGPESSFAMKMAFANTDILGPLLLKYMEQYPQGNATIRTTLIPTIFSSGTKGNVIPKTASAVVNLRILPGEKTKSVINYVRRIINDHRISIRPLGESAEPSEVTDIDSRAYQSMNRTIREIFPDVIVVPNLLVGGTDSRYFEDLTESIIRFRPFYLRPDNILSMHGTNERMPVKDLENGIRFFYQLIRNNS